MTDDIGVPEVELDWLDAMDHASATLQNLRLIYPSRMALLPETGHEAIRRAMDDVQGAVRNLHRAGKFVLGADRYEQYVREQIDNEGRREEQHGRYTSTEG